MFFSSTTLYKKFHNVSCRKNIYRCKGMYSPPHSPYGHPDLEPTVLVRIFCLGQWYLESDALPCEQSKVDLIVQEFHFQNILSRTLRSSTQCPGHGGSVVQWNTTFRQMCCVLSPGIWLNNPTLCLHVIRIFLYTMAQIWWDCVYTYGGTWHIV